MSNIAVVVFSFCRPDYLSQTIETMENCHSADKYDYFFFQDGFTGRPKNKITYKNIRKKNINDCINVVKNTKLPIADHRINKRNEGINYQINAAFDLFNDYNKIFFFEDDILISKWYLRLLDVASNEKPNAMISFHSIGEKPRTERDMRLMKKDSYPRAWGFVLTRKVWENIGSYWQERYNKEFTNTDKRSPYYDVILTQLVRQHTKGKYSPKVSRARNIGVEGVLSYNAANWAKKGLDKQVNKLTYISDGKNRNFIFP